MSQTDIVNTNITIIYHPRNSIEGSGKNQTTNAGYRLKQTGQCTNVSKLSKVRWGKVRYIHSPDIPANLAD